MARISHHWKTYTSWFVFENTDILWEKNGHWNVYEYQPRHRLSKRKWNDLNNADVRLV